MFDVRERQVPEQVVLTEQRSVRAAELVDWLSAAMDRLERSAEDHGGLSGPWFVVYHGVVTEEEASPVEVCAPIAAPRQGPLNVPMRREPAHREAFVRLTKEQTKYPEITSAFAAVDKWVRDRGLEVLDSPREVYFTDFDSAAPTDEVCDVAFPIR